MRFTKLLAATAIVAIATACSDSTGTVPREQALTADVAVVAGDAAYEDVGVIYAQVGSFGVPSGDIGRTRHMSGPCPYDVSAGRFICAEVTLDGRTVSRSYRFEDATGAPQSAFDSQTTERANFRSSIAGAVERDGWSATISHQRDMTQSGLSGSETEHTIDGTGSSTQSRSRHTDGEARTYTMSSVATFTSVVVPFPRARGMWPKSGSITRVVTATREGEGAAGTRTRTATTTFNGTRFATLVVGERTFTLDLATGRISR